MSKYSKQEIGRIVSELLSRGHEGDYWDYKREWPPKEENTDLIKDIISFANTTHSKDCFLIFGAEDNGQPHEMESPRRNQNQLLCLLNRVPQWAGHNQPTVSLENIVIEGHVYDIVIIYNSYRTPFYLQEDCIPEIKYPENATPQQRKDVDDRKKRKTLRQGVIYVRTEDNSTPFNKIANPFVIEELWKKRFHLLQPVLKQFISEMAMTDNWRLTEGEKYHSIYRPEFTFQYVEEDYQNTSFNEFYVKLFPDTNANRRIFSCNYFGTVLREVYTVSIDGGRWHIPYPKIASIGINKQRYFYFLEQSDDMVIYKFLNLSNTYHSEHYHTRLASYIPWFRNDNERLSFEQWLCNGNNQTLFLSDYESNWQVESQFTIAHERNEAATGRTIVKMLTTFRQMQ